MSVFQQSHLLVLFFGWTLAVNNLVESQGNTECGGILSEPYKALPIEVNANETCTWYIEKDVDQNIRIIFSYFQFNPSSICDRENIIVYDGSSTNSSFLGQICNSHQSVPVFESSSNALTFQLSTDSTAFKRAVFVFYYFISPDSVENCGGRLQSPEGSFTSPNYPSPHPPFTYCVWHIQTEANSKINLTFSEIFVEMDENCRFDFVAIYDGVMTNTGLIKQVCGLAKPTFESSSNFMTVVLSTDYANSYRGFSAHYTSIPIPTTQPNTSLRCSSDTITVILSKSYLDSLGYNDNDLVLNDPTCRPSASNPVMFSFPFNSCGTIKETQNHTISYINTITASPAGVVITRQKRVEIVVKCIMENNSTVEVMYVTETDVTQNTSALGRYNLSMSFYESDLFSKPILDSPYYVDLNQTLYAQVTLHSSDANLLVFVDTCIASPNPNFGSPNYDLVRSGCLAEEFRNILELVYYDYIQTSGKFVHNGLNVTCCCTYTLPSHPPPFVHRCCAKDNTYVAYPVLEHYGRFRFSSFKFLRSHPTVYLHCEVLICDSNDPNSRCTNGCITRQKREISSYKWKGEAMVGPLRLKSDHSSVDRSDSAAQVYPEKSQNAPAKGLYILTSVVLVTNAILLAGLAAKRFFNWQQGYSYQKLQSY